MIEAIALLPWVDEMARRDKAQVTKGINLLDCEDCKTRNPKEKRQMFGCGLEERVDYVTIPRRGQVKVLPWAPPGYLAIAPRDDKGKALRPKTCVGYTRTIPTVAETIWDLTYAEEWGAFEMKYGEWTEEHETRMRAAKIARGHVDRWSFDNPPPKKPGGP